MGKIDSFGFFNFKYKFLNIQFSLPPDWHNLLQNRKL